MWRVLKGTVLFVLVWLVFLNGCSFWKPVAEAPDETNLADLRVTLRDSRTLEVSDGFARADTLFGVADKELIAIPLTEITQIEERDEGKQNRVALLAISTLIVAALAAMVVFLSKSENIYRRSP